MIGGKKEMPRFYRFLRDHSCLKRMCDISSKGAKNVGPIVYQAIEDTRGDMCPSVNDWNDQVGD